MYKYETHLHTAQSSKCASSTGAEMVRAYKEAGYSGLFVTDHFVNGNTTVDRSLPWREQMLAFAAGYDDALEEGKRLGFDVFFGWEMANNSQEYLAYNLGVDFLIAHDNLTKLELDSFCELVHEHGGFISHAHPFRKAWYITEPAIVTIKHLDAIEVNNGSSDDPDNFNSEAWNFSRAHPQLIRTSGGDTHETHKAGIAGMAFPYKLKDADHFVKALRAGVGMPIIDGIVCDHEGVPLST